MASPAAKTIIQWLPDIPQSRLMRRRMLWAYAFVAAPIVALGLFLLGPILFSGWVSLHRWDMLAPVSEMPWRGLHNYIFLLTKDSVFLKSLGNTFFFAIGGVGANTVLGLGFALLLNSRIRGRALWRVLYFMPVISAQLALAVMFSFIFGRNFGVVNNIITALGLPRQPFLSGPSQALLTLIFIAIYQYIGYYIVIFLAGLQGIPQDYYAAAQVDGADRLQEFRFITLPLLRPVMLFVVVTNTIGALQVAFEQLKERLFQEGLFDDDRKLPLPAMPQRIGIVTSPTGAAIRDIIQVAHRRSANVHLFLYPVRVQGKEAAGGRPG